MIFKHPEACHGPCYVLDPDAWNRGERVVIKVIPAKNTSTRKKTSAKREVLAATALQTRRVAVWDKARAFDFWFEDVSVRTLEPRWAPRARELRANGWAYRKIAKHFGVAYNEQLVQHCTNKQ